MINLQALTFKGNNAFQRRGFPCKADCSTIFVVFARDGTSNYIWLPEWSLERWSFISSVAFFFIPGGTDNLELLGDSFKVYQGGYQDCFVGIGEASSKCLGPCPGMGQPACEFIMNMDWFIYCLVNWKSVVKENCHVLEYFDNVRNGIKI